MKFSKKLYQVKPNTLGYLYRNNVLEKELSPGTYKISDWRNRTELICLPNISEFVHVSNQEVLTKDNIALRFSFNLIYRIVDGKKFLSKFSLDKHVYSILKDAEHRVYSIVQLYISAKISEFDSESLNENKKLLTNFSNEEMNKEVAEFGILIEEVQIRNLTFPKIIQELFAKHLEAKIRAKSEIENARTAVATARTLKNASELMKDDDNIKFFQIIETITKIADKGKHTFMIGDIKQLSNK